jgi:L-amino acid N-acyltransferase YncA
MSQINIRMANLNDAEAIYGIYEPYILNTVITFECEKIPIESFRDRMRKILEKFPWLVCEVDGEIAGYAYCSPHMERAAYGWNCQCSIYLNEKYHHKGIGTALYKALLHIVKKQGFYNAYSIICIPNDGSVALHHKFGFDKVGIYDNTAYKLGQWRNVLIMEKHLNQTFTEPAPIIPVYELDRDFLQSTFKEVLKDVKL